MLDSYLADMANAGVRATPVRSAALYPNACARVAGMDAPGHLRLNDADCPPRGGEAMGLRVFAFRGALRQVGAVGCRG
jgi:hypothetical protein